MTIRQSISATLGLGLHKTNIIQSVKCTFLMRPNMYIYKTNWVLIAISEVFLSGPARSMRGSPIWNKDKKMKVIFVDVSTW